MVVIADKFISVTRGNTLLASVSMKDKETGDTIQPSPGDIVRFAVKKFYTNSDILIYKIIPNDTMILELEPDDTKDLPFGDYVFDIKIIYADGKEDTFITEGEFVVAKGVD